jgi:hypothetical protein
MHGKCIAADWWAPLRVFKRDNVNVFMYDCNSGLSQQFERTGVLGSATAVAIRLFGFPTATPLCLGKSIRPASTACNVQIAAVLPPQLLAAMVAVQGRG